MRWSRRPTKSWSFVDGGSGLASVMFAEDNLDLVIVVEVEASSPSLSPAPVPAVVGHRKIVSPGLHPVGSRPTFSPSHVSRFV